jgi:hypothetical protein
VVASSKVPTDPGIQAKSDTGTSLDPWSKFCAAADDGSKVALAVAANGVAASAAQ